MQKHYKKFSWNFLKLQIWNAVLFFGCIACLSTMATADTLPKGKCTDPKPKTDLRHCRFEGVDLRNKDLHGADLRGINLYKTQLQGADLTNALFSGKTITYAYLDGAKGLPEVGLYILKNQYAVTSMGNADFMISLLQPEYVAKTSMNIAGLDNIFLANKVASTQSTIALLSFPRYGDFIDAIIVARFENNNLDLPVCYRSVQPLDNRHYYPNISYMAVTLLSNGGFGIGVKISGSDGDELGISAWDKLVILELSATCKLTLLYEEYQSRVSDKPGKNQDDEWESGSKLDFRFMNSETVEIKTTNWSKVSSKKIKKNISNKEIKLNLHH